MTPAFARALNAAGLLAVSLVLVAAFLDQFVLGELPCPLCILQRAGFLGAALGLALNLRFGPRPSHYAVTIVSAFFGGLISLRQVALHVVPGSGTYGNALFGLHFYSWALLLFGIVVLGCAAMLLVDRQFAPLPAPGAEGPGRLGGVAFALLALATLMVLCNGVSTVLECAGGLCPDNPAAYELLPAWLQPGR